MRTPAAALKPLDPQVKVQVAAKHLLSIDSIERFLRGVPQKPLTVARIRAAFEAERVAIPEPKST